MVKARPRWRIWLSRPSSFGSINSAGFHQVAQQKFFTGRDGNSWIFSAITAFRPSTKKLMSRPRRVVAASRPVVSNTTPLINLIGIGQVDLLPSLYGEVTIPSEVRD